MSEVAIVVDGVNKSFKLPHERHSGVKQALINFRPGNQYQMQHVLRDVSFDIKKGEFFGIVGRNGSGKSTLLKLLAQTYVPNKGKIQVHGSLTPFIELGVGFNPELTGRENVYLNAALLGFSRRQTDGMLSDIVKFAELEEFMDQKLKNYSSGMQVRLAFSIAIRAKSDILLIDEVLAVGDEAFQRKCLDVFERYKAQKQTIILVTHDMETVRKFCTRAMLINDGEVVKIGNPRSVADKYSQLNQNEIDLEVRQSNQQQIAAQYLQAKLLGANRLTKDSFEIGDDLIVDLTWKGLEASRIESIGINIFKLSGEHITGINTRFRPHHKDWKDRQHIGLKLKLDIAPGKYFILVEAFEKERKVIDAMPEGPQFTVTSPANMRWSGLFELPHTWIEDDGAVAHEG